LTSPVKKGKKKPKKRVADIQEISVRNSPVVPRKKEEEAKATNFQEKVETLYKEAGASWIVILNEMQEENEKERQIERQKEKEELKKKRLNRIQSSRYNIDEILKEGQKMEEDDENALLSPTSNSPPSLSVTPPTAIDTVIVPPKPQEVKSETPTTPTPTPDTTSAMAVPQTRTRGSVSSLPRIDLAAQAHIASSRT
jgi:hypothetical protein